MPPRTHKEKRFMKMCEHADHPPERCPSRAVAKEMGAGKPTGKKKSKR